jgi:hypothetical protein
MIPWGIHLGPVMMEGPAKHQHVSHMTSAFVLSESRSGPLRLSRLGTDDAQASPGSHWMWRRTSLQARFHVAAVRSDPSSAQALSGFF